MPSASELRVRISSIRETKKVTDAMYMISSVKMRKAKRGLDATKPYFNALREEIGDLLKYFPKTVNRYFRNTDREGIRGRALVLITSDKGLAGSYNQEAIRAAEQERGTVPYRRIRKAVLPEAESPDGGGLLFPGYVSDGL